MKPPGTASSTPTAGGTSVAHVLNGRAQQVSAFASSAGSLWDDDALDTTAAAGEQLPPMHQKQDSRQPLGTPAAPLRPVPHLTGARVRRSKSVTLSRGSHEDAGEPAPCVTSSVQPSDDNGPQAGAGSAIDRTRSWGLFTFKKGLTNPKKKRGSAETEATADAGRTQGGETASAHSQYDGTGSDGAAQVAATAAASAAGAPLSSRANGLSRWGAHRPSSAPPTIAGSTAQLASIVAVSEPVRGGTTTGIRNVLNRSTARPSDEAARVSAVGPLTGMTVLKPPIANKSEGTGSGLFAGLFTSRSGGSRPASAAKSTKAGEPDEGESTSSRSSTEGGAARISGDGTYQTADSSRGSQREPLMSGEDSSRSAEVEPSEKPGGHRRGRSLSSIIMPHLKGRRASATADELHVRFMVGGYGFSFRASWTPQELNGAIGALPPIMAEQSAAARPKLTEGRRNSSMGCFGGGKPLDGDGAAEILRLEPPSGSEPLLPAGLVGLRNLGNTCFVNAAVQCLRYTPGLPLMLLPDLLEPPPGTESTPAFISPPAPDTPPSRASGTGSPAISITVSVSARPALSNEVPKAPAQPPVLSSSPSNPLSDSSIAGTSPVVVHLEISGTESAAVAQRFAGQAPPQSSTPAVHAVPASGGALIEEQACPVPRLLTELPSAAQAHSAATRAADELQPPSSGPHAGLQSTVHPAARAASNGSAAVQVLSSAACPRAAPPSSITVANFAPDDPSLESTAFLGGSSAQLTELSTASNRPSTIAPVGRTVSASDIACQLDGGAAECATPGGPLRELSRAEAPRVPGARVKAEVPPLVKGQMVDAFRQLVRELFLSKAAYVDPGCLLERLAALDAGEDFINGGQHDCEELLSAVMDRLHEDLNVSEGSEGDGGKNAPGCRSSDSSLESRSPDIAELGSIAVSAKAPSDMSAVVPRLSGRMARPLVREVSIFSRNGDDELSRSESDDVSSDGGDPCQAESPEPEIDKAERLWEHNLKVEDSPVTDLFAGQLQGNIVCHKCKSRFTKYEVFRGLSLPLVKEVKAGISSWFSNNSKPASIQDCLAAFTADEVLAGSEDVYYDCETCVEHTAATLSMRIQRPPRILQLHIKRFKYTGVTREKLTANVSFPLKGLKLSAYASEECNVDDGAAEYDLYGVINHYGSLSAGHYTATCRVTVSPGKEEWYSFNDENVYRLPPQGVVTFNAYILFYVRRQ